MIDAKPHRDRLAHLQLVSDRTRQQEEEHLRAALRPRIPRHRKPVIPTRGPLVWNPRWIAAGIILFCVTAGLALQAL